MARPKKKKEIKQAKQNEKNCSGMGRAENKNETKYIIGK